MYKTDAITVEYGHSDSTLSPRFQSNWNDLLLHKILCSFYTILVSFKNCIDWIEE